MDWKYDQHGPVYEEVEDNEGGEGEDCDHNGGKCRHLKDLKVDIGMVKMLIKVTDWYIKDLI